MFRILRHLSLAVCALVAAGCDDAGRTIDGSLGVVEVIETPPVEPIVPGVEPFIQQPSVLVFPERGALVPRPIKHAVTVRFSSANATQLDVVQSIEVEVDVEGGVAGDRQIHALFVNPQGLVWERQLELVENAQVQRRRARFSLPVAATFIADQRLSGTWEVRTLDDGVEQTTTTFRLEE